MHIHILQLCVIQAAASFIHLEPRNVSVLRGREVRFNCSTNAPWDVMNWRLGEDTILVVSVEHGTLARSESISTVNHSMSSLTVWELILSNSSFSQTVQEIRCELLPTNLKSSSALFVQEKGSVRILEGDLSVQRGVFVTFHCQAIGWYPEPSVLWMVNGTSVDRSDYNTSSIQETNNLFNSTSELQLKADTSTTVECWASVSAPLSRQNSSVKLTVVAPKSTQDYTVVIAVIVSVCTIILLAVLILILCYRKKLAKSSSENKASFYSSWADNLSCERRSVADETSGKVNLGYNTEDITSSGHSDLGNRADSTIYISSSPQVPDIVIFSSQNQDLYSNSAKKTVRQVTTV
ncbi:immunoglobulin superfamily member 5 isoform X1 [Danio aesculapii]|uniref:immunoglobulin superfamily member 5 isoform X1 n=1 Tax=Danio aesculapii TaxID=1142201 RepID=UPI0024BFBBC1|nr:immunoglobulin superfamily member 5 isoform X1 [Danio aesculapii]